MLRTEPPAPEIAAPSPQPETAYAWMRLIGAFVLSTIGGVGMWSVVVALPPIQAGVRRRTLRCIAARTP